MQCISPIKAAYSVNGDLIFNNRNHSLELEGIRFECRKCLPCRLNIAREKAIRCWHESKFHDQTMFLTLTYDDKHLKSDKLVYEDFQVFMRKLRRKSPNKINYLVTGEYGDEKKRPHWHAIIFGYRPSDETKHYVTDRGDQVFTSSIIDELWGNNDPDTKPSEIGEVNIDSAGYVARYASKKLIHGKDGTHEYDPIHKTSSRRAIGRSWIEQYYEHTFENGFIVLPNGQKSKIPRYYIDWAKEHKYDYWHYYITEVRPKIQEESAKKARKEELDYVSEILNRDAQRRLRPHSQAKIKLTILNQKFKQLQERLKL